MKKTARIAAVGVIATLALTACGSREDDDKSSSSSDDNTSSSAPTDASSSPTEAAQQYPDFKACMVSDSGGFDDKSFNQTSHDGLTKAVSDFGMQTAEVESNDPSQFKDNIQAMVDQGCNSITTVGFLLADDTLASAKVGVSEPAISSPLMIALTCGPCSGSRSIVCTGSGRCRSG